MTDQNINKLFPHLVDFVYKEMINEFLNKNGVCSESTFFLINWSVLIEKQNSGINSEL